MFNLEKFLDSPVNLFKGLTLLGSVYMWDSNGSYRIVQREDVIRRLNAGWLFYANR